MDADTILNRHYTREAWIDKAERVFAQMNDAISARSEHEYSYICYWAGCVNLSYLNALAGSDYPLGLPLEDQNVFLDRIEAEFPTLKTVHSEMVYLFDFDESINYPGRNANLSMVVEVLKSVLAFRKAAREALNLPPE